MEGTPLNGILTRFYRDGRLTESGMESVRFVTCWAGLVNSVLDL